MPTYEFACDDCNTVVDWRGSFDDRPKEIPCECGGVRGPCLGLGSATYVKGQTWDFIQDPADKRSTIPNIGRRVRSAEAQERIYNRMVNARAKRAREKNRSRHRRREDDIKYLGTVPRELFEARKNQTGNKQYWFEEGKDALRREGLLAQE